MAINPNILLGIQQPQVQAEDPIGRYAKIMALQNGMGQQDLQGLQIQEAKRGADANERLRALFATGTPTDSQVMAIDPKTGMQYAKNRLDMQSTQATLDKTKLETQAKQAQIGRDLIAGATPDTYADVIAQGKALNQAWATNAPLELLPEWQRKHVRDATSFLKDIEPKIQAVNAGGTTVMREMNPNAPGYSAAPIQHTLTPGEVQSGNIQRAQLGETKRHNSETEASAKETAGRDKLQIVTDTDGNITVVDKNTRVGKPATDAQGVTLKGRQNLTESQGKAAGLAMRATEANRILNGLEDKGVTTRGIMKQGVESVPFIGGGLGMAVNALPGAMGGPSGEQQQVEQARRDFVNAVLRVESGASINESEFRNAERQYFPQPGDTSDVIKQKRTNRDTAIKSLEMQAGPSKRQSGIDPAKLSDAELKRELGI